MIKPKLIAFSIHVGIGVLLSACVSIVVLSWYPDFLFWLDGGVQLLILIVAIDLVLGPCLTFIVYSPKKSARERVLDLSLVALIQLGGLSYGLYAGYISRPELLVFSEGRITSVSWRDLEAQVHGLDYAATLSGDPLPWQYSPPPHSTQEMLELYSAYQSDGIKLEARFNKLSTLEAHWQEVVSLVSKANSNVSSRQDASYVDVPFAGRYGDARLKFTRDGQFVGVVDQDDSGSVSP